MWKRIIIVCGYFPACSAFTSKHFLRYLTFSSRSYVSSLRTIAISSRSFSSTSGNNLDENTSPKSNVKSPGMWQHPQHHRRKVHHLEPGEISPKEEISPDQTFYFIRHGVTEMNEVLMSMEWGSPGFFDKGLWDTQLSQNGIQQTVELNRRWKAQYDAEPSPASHLIPWEHIDLVISSPLIRTLQTYSYLVDHSLPPLIPSHIPKIAHPLLRERLYLSSDAGSPRSMLENTFPAFNFSALPEDDSAWWYTPETHEEEYEPYKEWRPAGEYLCPGEPADVFFERLMALRSYLLRRPEKHIVVVAHWGIIRGLTGGDFRNCEVRAVRATDILPDPFIDP